MPGDYTTLATIHRELKLGSFAHYMTPRLIDYAQRNHWMGRQILDLGCGTGESLKWLGQHGYIVTGVDESRAMLNIANQNLIDSGLSPKLVEQDIRQLQNIGSVDLALAIDVFNEFNNLKELEECFQSIHNVLKDGKLLAFDLYTIEGLVKRSTFQDELEHNSDELTIVLQNNFDYERQVHQRQYLIFRQNGDAWQRQTSYRILRAYPIQGITALLKRCRFEVQDVLNQDLSPYTPNDSTPKVVILATKS